MSRSHSPTDAQRTEVTTIVAKGTDMCTAALASVDVLFTDDEMARCNTSGTKGFHRLDSGELGFLVSVLQKVLKKVLFTDLTQTWQN